MVWPSTSSCPEIQQSPSPHQQPNTNPPGNRLSSQQTPNETIQDHIEEPIHSISNPEHHSESTSSERNEIDNTTNIQQIIPSEQKMYRSIPYVPSLSERITKILSKDYPNIAIATRQIRTIKAIHSKVKFPVSKEEQSNIIYKIPCNNCEGCYIGMTKNNLRKRLAGHKSNINKLDRLLNSHHTDTAVTALSETTTALITHSVERCHTFNLDHTKIIDHSYKTNTLPFLEMCHISNTDNTVNKRTDVEGLNTTYAALLHSIKNFTHCEIRRD